LRIDRLEIVRDAISTNLRTSIDITRILVAGISEEEGKSAAPATDDAKSARDPALEPAAWKGVGLDAAFRDDSLDTGTLVFRAVEDKSQALRVESLPAGASYDLYLDMTASGSGTVAICDETGAQEFPGGAPLRNDGRPYRYHLQFTAPAGPGDSISLCVPCLRLDAAGTVVSVSKCVLKRAME